ncbi:MAG: glycoside hydrolase family 2 [Lachnospiraceae bacterium]|nr:glycoside hydrolase family 2 [Lachnospiraceae bacterium]
MVDSVKDFYPRPQLVRDNIQALDGEWEIDGKKVIVPYPPESKLSGFKGKTGDVYKYKKIFRVDLPDEGRILLHFGAVDNKARFFVNKKEAGCHEGGYLSFTLDITDFISRQGDNELEVEVFDNTDNTYPYGKQRIKRGGMWYTPVSGIWKSVWMERVPESYIKDVRITPSLKGITLEVTTNDPKGADMALGADVTLSDGTLLHHDFGGGMGIGRSAVIRTFIKIDGAFTDKGELYSPRLWTPEDPYLYSIKIYYMHDVVESYFALRTIEIGEVNGVKRVLLNGKPVFMHGVLDQGYFSDGIFTPKSPFEYEKDILRMKELGLNMIRKHIKVEPESFYYFCDRHGMMVFQDMVNNGKYSYFRDTVLPTVGFRKHRLFGKRRTKEEKKVFERHMRDTLKELYNHPCIVAYTIFNEGWGEFDADRMYLVAKGEDPTRLYDSASGWFGGKLNDFDSVHNYFSGKADRPKNRPLFISEFGGVSYPVKGHMFNEDKPYGYGSAGNSTELTDRIIARYREIIIPVIKEGACGSVYTQLSDVEDEINGFYTYDREVLKVDKEKMLALSEEIKGELKRI